MLGAWLHTWRVDRDSNHASSQASHEGDNKVQGGRVDEQDGTPRLDSETGDTRMNTCMSGKLLWARHVRGDVAYPLAVLLRMWYARLAVRS